MSVTHFKGVRIGLLRSGRVLRLRFYPDYLDRPELSGLVDIDLESWQYEVVEGVQTEGWASDTRCVTALIHKLKKTEWPEAVTEVYFIA